MRLWWSKRYDNKAMSVEEMVNYLVNMFDCNLRKQHQELSDCSHSMR